MHIMYDESFNYVGIKKVISDAISNITEIDSIISKNREKYYEDTRYIDDFDVRALAEKNMEIDNIKTITRYGKDVVALFRSIETSVESLYPGKHKYYMFQLDTAYSNLCSSETEKEALLCIRSIINTLSAFLSMVEMLEENKKKHNYKVY